MEKELQRETIRVLKTIIDPEVGINIWDFGLIYGVLVKKINRPEKLLTTYKKLETKTSESLKIALAKEKKIERETKTEANESNEKGLEEILPDLPILTKNPESDSYYCHILMTFTSVNCPVIDILPMEIRRKINHLFDASNIRIEIVWEPRWDMSLLTEDIKFELGFL